MPRPKNTDQRRQEIVLALLKVMADQGYAHATIQAIAKEAGLRPGLIHYHFQTKQEILVELIRQVAAMGQQRYEQLSAEATTAKERLKAFIDARLAQDDTAVPEAVAAWVVIGTEAIRQPEVRAAYEKTINAQTLLLCELLREITGNKSNEEDRHRLAAIIVAAIEGAYQLSVAASNVMPKAYAAQALQTLVDAAMERLTK